MSFYKGELNTFDLSGMSEDIQKNFFISICENGISKSFKSINEEICLKLKEHGELYFSFGKREGDYLFCANEKKYKVDDERNKDSQGIYLCDAYFNKYDDINLGFLISYEDEKINIEPALEGESVQCRMYEKIEDCGDIHKDMKIFIENYIV